MKRLMRRQAEALDSMITGVGLRDLATKRKVTVLFEYICLRENSLSKHRRDVAVRRRVRPLAQSKLYAAEVL